MRATSSHMNHESFKAACAEHVAPGLTEAPFDSLNSMPAAEARTQSPANLDGHQDVPSSPDPFISLCPNTLSALSFGSSVVFAF